MNLHLTIVLAVEYSTKTSLEFLITYIVQNIVEVIIFLIHQSEQNFQAAAFQTNFHLVAAAAANS